MKDPLHLEKTVYDILEIPENADKTTIETGYKNAIMRKNVEANSARRTILDPTDRALEDILIYRNDYLSLLDLDESNINQLRTNRPAVFRKWSELNKKNFPEIGPSTFCIAVLLYWWAVNEEEYHWCIKAGNRNREPVVGSPGIEDLWQKNIAYWVSIINSEHAILAWLNNKNHYNVVFTADKAKAICQKLSTHFSRVFDKYIQRSQESGDRDRTEMYRSLELSFNSDLDTAAKIREIGFKKDVNGRSYPIYCGKLMLQEVEQLAYINSQLEVLKVAYVKNERIKKIIDKVAISLSEYHYITLMINDKNYDGALKTIEGLSIFERSREEVITIQATALFEKGKNLMESDLTDEAISFWKELQNIERLSEEYSREIAMISKAKAADILQRSPESSVKLITDSLKLVKHDTELEQLLALAYSRMGMMKLEKASRGFEKDKNLDKVKKAIESAVIDLEKSIALNPKDANTVENLKQAKEFLRNLSAPVITPSNPVSESISLNAEGIRLLNEAAEDSKKGNTQEAMFKALTAVGSFSEAHRLNPGDPIIKKNVEVAGDWLNQYTKEHNEKQNLINQQSTEKKTNYALARTFFVLSLIALFLLWILDKKII